MKTIKTRKSMKRHFKSRKDGDADEERSKVEGSQLRRQ